MMAMNIKSVAAEKKNISPGLLLVKVARSAAIKSPIRSFFKSSLPRMKLLI